MQPEAHAVFRACRTDRHASPIIETGKHVGFAIELDVDDADVVSCRPNDGLLETQAAANIDTDSVTQRHPRSLVHGRIEAAARLEEIAVFAVTRGVLRASEEQPLAAGCAVLAIVLEQAKGDLLVVRIVADAGGDEREAPNESRAIDAGCQIGLRQGHTLSAVERDDRRL